MFNVLFTEGGKPLAERRWPAVPRVGETLALHDSTGRFEVIRVHWEERSEVGLIAHVSLRAVGT
jgi:hypothetical protein